MPTRLILIRHGQTAWNRKGKYAGFTDVGLNETGRRQARKLRKRFKEEEIHRVFSSDRRRAIETAAIVFKGRRVETEAVLREIHFGRFEGFTHREILKKYPVVYSRWLRDPFSVKVPGGESLTVFRRRVLGGVKKIISRYPGKTIALVSHGGVISALMMHVLKTKNFWRCIPDSASVSVIEFENGKTGIKVFNDVSHLSKRSA